MYEAAPNLPVAARDYRWLLDRGYSGAAALKLVGDRFQLAREERLVLFRAVAAAATSARRRSLLHASPRGLRILVDGYNQILTVYHYLGGRPVFVSADGFLRDAGGAHGRIADQGRYDRASAILVDAFAEAGPLRVAVYFDAPVPGSAGHARRFRDALGEKGIDAEAFVEKSADAPLKLAIAGDVVATSDSAILDALVDRAGTGAFDAARAAIEAAFGERPWLDLGSLLDQKTTTAL